MSARCRNLEPRAFRRCNQFATRPVHFDAQLTDVLADARAGFHDRLVKLIFNLLRDVWRNLGDDVADVRTQLARRRIYNLKFLFDADSKAVSHGVALWSLGRV